MVARIKVEKKKNNFTIVPNEILQSKDLSLQAKGLIAQCLSFPDNWNYSINGLVSVVKEGKTAVMNTIKELERNGYVKRNRIHDANGKFAGIEYVITDYPNSEKPYAENQNMVQSQQINHIPKNRIWLNQIWVTQIRETSHKIILYIKKKII